MISVGYGYLKTSHQILRNNYLNYFFLLTKFVINREKIVLYDDFEL